MTSIELVNQNIANKNQIKLAFGDLIYRLSPQEIKSFTTENFIDICNKKYNLMFTQELVQEVFDEIYEKVNEKEQIIADYELTKKCLINIMVKFSIFEQDTHSIEDYYRELNLNNDYSFDKNLVVQIFNDLKGDIIIEI